MPVPAGTITSGCRGDAADSAPGMEPKSTVGIPVNPVPLTVTVLPPAWGPLFGLTPVTVGAAL